MDAVKNQTPTLESIRELNLVINVDIVLEKANAIILEDYKKELQAKADALGVKFEDLAFDPPLLDRKKLASMAECNHQIFSDWLSKGITPVLIYRVLLFMEIAQCDLKDFLVPQPGKSVKPE